MTTIPKTFLAISLTAFSIGFVVTFGNFDLPPIWTVAMPLGAVCFELFLITFILRNESAKFSEEERARFQNARAAQIIPGIPATRPSQAPAQGGRFITAPSH